MHQRHPTHDELSVVASTLRRLREHYHQWPHYEGRELELLAFALYEGCGGSECCGTLIAEAAPLALGSELVEKHGFEWLMLQHGSTWHFAVTHPRLDSPIDLHALEDGRWDERPDDYDEPPDPGEPTINSLDMILQASTKRRLGAR